MKQYFELMKVVDPHRNMPKDIRGHLLEGLRHQELNNDTFVRWTVGDYKAEYEAFLIEQAAREEEEDEAEYEEEDILEDEEDDPDEYGSYEEEEYLPRLAKVDKFLLKHFKKGEELIILYWW